jgi:hypothetical protein
MSMLNESRCECNRDSGRSSVHRREAVTVDIHGYVVNDSGVKGIRNAMEPLMRRKANVEDVKLTPREMVWECEPRYMHSSTLRVVFQETEHANRYNLLAGDTIVAESYVGDRQDDLMFIDFRAVGVTATRRPAYVLGSQDDKPLVPANALSGISNPKLGEVASVLGWNAKTTKEGE